MGDSGTWVVGESNNELYGHVIGKDMFGDAYVIPIRAIFDDISTRLGATSVCIPDNEICGDLSLSGKPIGYDDPLLEGYSIRHHSGRTEHPDRIERSLDSGYSIRYHSDRTEHSGRIERSRDSVYSLELEEPPLRLNYPTPYYLQEWDEPLFDSGYSTRHHSEEIRPSLDSDYSERHNSSKQKTERSIDSGYSTRHPSFDPNPER